MPEDRVGVEEHSGSSCQVKGPSGVVVSDQAMEDEITVVTSARRSRRMREPINFSLKYDDRTYASRQVP